MYTIFYFTGGKDPREVAASLGEEGRCRWGPGGELLVIRDVEGEDLGVEYKFVFHTRAATAKRAVIDTSADLIIVDARKSSEDAPPQPFRETEAYAFIEDLVGPEAPAPHTVPKSHILAIVDDDHLLGENSYAVGVLRIAGSLPDPVGKKNLLFVLDRFLRKDRGGKIAICLAGGGVEGLIYELGVLLAIDDFMVNCSVNDFDVFCGISCGGMINSFLVNGVRIEDLAMGIYAGEANIDKFARTQIFKPNVQEVLPRLIEAARTVATHRTETDFEALAWSLIPSGAFTGEDLKWWLERQLTREGRTNNFNQLEKELYIGVTDSDNARHVVFGEPGLTDVPISHVVRASMALVPFYGPETLKGRHYIDGAFTRTTNVQVAIRHGAKLAFLVNPWEPFQAPEAGFVERWGGGFLTLQALKCMVSSRFHRAGEHFDELFPDVSVHLFAPEGEELQEMRGTLMKFFYRIRLADFAYRKTIQKIRRRFDVFARDFERFGIKLHDPDHMDEQNLVERFSEVTGLEAKAG
jgi:predicted acylesterase/phospholipase RssA